MDRGGEYAAAKLAVNLAKRELSPQGGGRGISPWA